MKKGWEGGWLAFWVRWICPEFETKSKTENWRIEIEREREQYVIIISILKSFDPSLTRTLYLRVFFLDLLLESKQKDVTNF
jgi:hypothetical protein